MNSPGLQAEEQDSTSSLLRLPPAEKRRVEGEGEKGDFSYPQAKAWGYSSLFI